MSEQDYCDYGIEVTSPEISKKDKGAAAITFKTCIDALQIIAQWGTVTPKSLAEAARLLAKEHIDVDLEVLTDEELTACMEPEALPEETPVEEPEIENPKIEGPEKVTL